MKTNHDTPSLQGGVVSDPEYRMYWALPSAAPGGRRASRLSSPPPGSRFAYWGGGLVVLS